MKFNRRKFLVGASASAIAASLPEYSFAWSRHGGGALANFNGGKMELNLGTSANAAGNYLTLNLAKSGQAWGITNSISPFVAEPSNFAADGYPNNIPVGSGGFHFAFATPIPWERTGIASTTNRNYVFKWTGDGTVYADASFTAIAYVITAAVSSGSQTVLTLTPSSTPNENNHFNIRVGQVLAITNIFGTGWQTGGLNNAGINNSWIIQAVNAGSNTITINFDSHAAGAVNLTSNPRATNTKSTSVADGGGSLSGSGRFVCTTNQIGGQFLGGIGTVSVQSSTNYPKAFIFCDEDDEALIDAGQMFSVKEKNVLASLKCGSLRFMDWINGASVENDITNWWTRRSIDYPYWGGPELRASLYGGQTVGTGNDMTVTAPPSNSALSGAPWDGVLHDKTTVLVLFTTSTTATIHTATNNGNGTTTFGFTTSSVTPVFSIGDKIYVDHLAGGTWNSINTQTFTITAASAGSVTFTLDSSGFGTYTADTGDMRRPSPTINVGGTGAKVILNEAGASLAPIQNFNIVAGTANSMGCLIYNALWDAWTLHWQSWLQNGAPLEAALRLCNEVGAHPHFTMPYHACNPLTDFLPTFAAYVKANSPSWMIPRFEGQNEVWNNPSYANQEQAMLNGAKAVSGVATSTTYSVSAVTYVANTSMTVTLSTLNNVFVVGSHVNLASFGGLTGAPTDAYVSAINVGGNPNVITLNAGPASGTYTSGGTVAPVMTDYPNWYGALSSKMGQALATIYNVANLGTKYWSVVGVQKGLGSSAGSRNGLAPQLNSNGYVLGLSAQSPYTATAGSLWTSHICCDMYLNSGVRDQSGETTLATTFAGTATQGYIVNGVLTKIGGDSPVVGNVVFCQGVPLGAGVTVASGTGPWTLSDLTINFANSTLPNMIFGGTSQTPLKTYIDDFNSGTNNQNLPTNLTYYQGWVVFLSGFGNNNAGKQIVLTAYEGGPQLGGGVGGSVPIFRYAASFVTSSTNYPTGLQGVVAQSLSDFTGAGGVFPSQYGFTANTLYPTDNLNIWAFLQDIYQTPMPPIGLAIAAFNA